MKKKGKELGGIDFESQRINFFFLKKVLSSKSKDEKSDDDLCFYGQNSLGVKLQ